MQLFIDELNSEIENFLSNQIDSKELQSRVRKISKPNTEELLAKTGNSLICVVMEAIFELSLAKDPEKIKSNTTFLQKYIDEREKGVPIQDTKISFSYSFRSPSFSADVKYNDIVISS